MALAPDFAVVESGFSLLRLQALDGKKPRITTGKKPKPVPHSVPNQMPELDPSAAASAVLLLVGGTLVAFGRQRSPSQRESDSLGTSTHGHG